MIYTIPKGISGFIINARREVNSYQVNEMCRLFSYMCVLKAQTSSGVIKLSETYRSELKGIFECSYNTVDSILNKLDQLGFIEWNDYNYSIRCKSWDYICKELGADYYGTEELKFDSIKQLHYAWYILEIKENQAKQLNRLFKQLNSHPEIYAGIKAELAKIADTTIEEIELLSQFEFVSVLYAAQLQSFRSGSPEFDLLNFFRADLNRCAYTLFKSWNMKGARSVAYVKRKLASLKLAIVSKGPAVESAVLRIREFNKKYADGYNRETNKKIWFQCDSIQPLF